MRKEYILTEEEKARKRAKIEENRLREKEKTSPHAGNNMCMQGVSVNLMDSTTQHMRDLERTGSINYTPQSEVSSGTRTLSLEDQELIQELCQAYKGSLEINMEREPSREDASSVGDLANIAEISVRRVIDMAKKIRAFKALPQVDQISLLKGGSIELLILRSVITFDKEKQHFLDPLDKEETSAMNLEQLRKAEGGKIFEAHMKFVKSLAIDIGADQTSLILLLVISLFSPDRSNLINKDLVGLEQERYSMLLCKYLESSYPPHLAKTYYPKLLMKLTDIRNLNEEHSQVLLKVNPEGLQPLMQEVLDLHA